MLVIGLTGGIGAGKSTVAEMLGRHGAVVIDVDALGREVIGPGGSAVEAVVARFGQDVRGPDGSIDRPSLANRVFGDPESLAALNAISHPAINALLDERLTDIADRSPDSIVVLDMAVLTESDLGREIRHPYELVTVVEAPRALRIARLVERGLTAEDAGARMASQATDEERRAVADHVIDNSGDLKTTGEQVDELWAKLVAPGSSGMPETAR